MYQQQKSLTKEDLQVWVNSEEDASQEDIARFNLFLKEKLKNCQGFTFSEEKTKQEIHIEEIRSAKERRKYYRENDYVCCVESLELAGAKKRQYCLENNYRFSEY